MASVVDICNLALAHLGDEATVSSISPSDGSAQADHCVRFYPIARDVLLELHDWNFARRRTAMAETANTPPDVWAYEYAMPANVIRVRAVLDESGDEDKPRRFLQGTDANGAKVIWTNEPSATLLYTHAITDTTKFSGLFVNALSYLLASYLAGPITKSVATKEGMYKMFKLELGNAAMSSANANKNPATHNVDWVSQRGYTNPRMVDGRVVYE
jgi:hypothetical protein